MCVRVHVFGTEMTMELCIVSIMDTTDSTVGVKDIITITNRLIHEWLPHP